jgi:hypothetical protein
VSTDIATQDAQSSDLSTVAPLDRESAAGALAHVLGTGDLYQLSNEQRVAHYVNLCRSQGFNALTRPYQWIEFKETESGPPVLTLYLKPTGAAQMLRNHHVSVKKIRNEVVGELFVCEVEGRQPDGRTMTASKYVSLVNKYGKLPHYQLKNALMAAETGAHRRLALAMFGGAAGPDADEAAEWRAVTVDGTGAVLDDPTAEQKALAADPVMAKVIREPVYEDAVVPEMDGPDQRPRAAEIDPPKPEPGPRPSFRPSEEEVGKLLRTFHATVKGLSLSSDDARHQLIKEWTADVLGWPKGKRCESLKVFFARATPEESADLLAHVRAEMEAEQQHLLGLAAGAAAAESTEEF